MRRPLLCSMVLALLSLAPAVGQEITDVQVVGHIYQPLKVDPTPERVAALEVPDGFEIDVWAEGLGKPRMIAVAEDGTVYVTRRDPGDVLMLRDADHDGRADGHQILAPGHPLMHGIALHDGDLYLTTVTELFRATRHDDGTLGPLETLIDDLPNGGQHPNRTIAFGPDGMLYITTGSTCNACDETNEENATILRADPDNGYQRTIFATGLRNTIGFGWSPVSGEMYGADHGIDWLGDNEQKEEFNHLNQGHQYGWPYIYADSKHNPADEPPHSTYEQWADASTEPDLLYTAHAAPLQMTFWTGANAPAQFRNDALIAMHGSWNRKPPSGHEVVRVLFDDQGHPTDMQPLVTGFINQREDGEYERFARPAGIAQMPDGSILIGDDMNGVIYRLHTTP